MDEFQPFLDFQNKLWEMIVVKDKDGIKEVLNHDSYVDVSLLLKIAKKGWYDMLVYILTLKQMYFTFVVEREELLDVIEETNETRDLIIKIKNIKINYNYK